MEALVKQFLDYISLIKKMSSHTVLSYENDISSFNAYVADQYEIKEVKFVSHLMIRSWIVQLKSNGLSNSSINRKISALKSFFKFLIRKEIIEVNPMAKVLTLKKSKRLPSYVPKQKMDYLLEESLIENNSFSLERNELVIALLYMTGIRRSELIAIKVKDVNRSRGEIKVMGKGGKERICPITNGMIQRIDHYLDCRNAQFGPLDHDVLIVTDKGKPCYPKLIYNIVDRKLKSVNAADRTSPHVLRHTFATHLSANGAELNAVKELLGHASLAATQVYTHNSIDRLRKEYQKAHPKGE